MHFLVISDDIHHKSRTLRTKHLTWPATDILTKSSKHFNPLISKRMSMDDEDEEKQDEKNLIRVLKTNRQSTQAGRKIHGKKIDQLAVRTVTERKIDQPAGNWKDNTKKQKVFIPKTPAARSTHARDNFTPVLILAYFRSGSSWLGNMIRQSDRTFYVLEPFKLLQQQSYYNVGSICYNNNTCR